MKILAIILTIIFLSFFAGCGDDRVDDKIDQGSSNVVNNTTPTNNTDCAGLSQSECDQKKNGNNNTNKIPGDNDNDGKCENGENCYIEGDTDQDGECDNSEPCFIDGDNNRNGKCEKNESCYIEGDDDKDGKCEEGEKCKDKDKIDGDDDGDGKCEEGEECYIEGDDDQDGQCEKGEECYDDDKIDGDDDGDGKCEEDEECHIEGDDDQDGKCEKGEECYDDKIDGDDDGDGKCEEDEECYDDETCPPEIPCEETCEDTECEEIPECEIDPDFCCEDDCEEEPEPDKLVLSLGFDEGYGTISFDETNNENNAKLINADWTDCSVSGKAIFLNGKDGLVKIYSDSTLALDASFSLDFSVRRAGDGSSGTETIFAYGKDGNFELYYDKEESALFVRAMGKAYKISETTLKSWTKVSVKYSKKTLKIELDGEELLSKGVEFKLTQSAIYLGANDTTDYFRGYIDELSINN